jgi:hypothetical protein
VEEHLDFGSDDPIPSGPELSCTSLSPRMASPPEPPGAPESIVFHLIFTQKTRDIVTSLSLQMLMVLKT